MKKVLYIVIALGMVSTFAGAGWIEPVGTSFANFETAKKVCRAAGGRLPTFNELKKVPQSCGVRVAKFGHNGNEMPRTYYSCTRQKGFMQKTYWTKTPSKKTPSYIIIVDFFNAGESSNSPFGERAHIRCIK